MSRNRQLVRSLESGLRITDGTVAGRHGPIPTRRYVHPSTESVGVLVWAHGGAFVSGGLDQLESHAVAAALAQRGIEVVAVDYQLVPKCSYLRDAPPGPLPGVRFPVPLEDLVDAYTAVAADRPGAALGGASAGAALTSTAALRLAAEGKPVPSGLVLAYGTYHAELPDPSPELRSRTSGRHSLLQFRPETVRRLNRNYAGTEEALGDPHAFAGGHDLTGMPPAVMVDADRDVLRASSEIFARELTDAGVPVERHIVQGSRHGFLNEPGRPHFMPGIELITTWMSSRTTHQHEEHA